MFPIETPDPNVKGSHLFRQFRPSFAKSFHKPLNPDCHTGFSPFNKKTDKTEIEEATRELVDKVSIRSFMNSRNFIEFS